MDNNQMNELQQAMDEFNAALRGMSSNISGLSQSENQARRELDAYRASINHAKDAQYAATKKVTDGVVNFAKSAASSANSFDVLKDAISVGAKAVSSLVGLMPVVGGALKAFGESAGDVAKMMVDQFQTGYNAYKELADIGLANSFEDMKESAASAGLLFQDLSKSVGKYSTDLSNLGAGTMQGMKRFREVSAVLDDQKAKYMRMGIGIEEFTEYQAKFMAQETRQGRAKNMTAEQLAKGTTSYIDQLDMLSKLTGASRKDLQSQRDAAQSETKFASATELMDTGVKKMFEDMNVLIANKGGASLAQGFRDLASGSVSTDAAKQLMLQSGGMAGDIVEKLRNGSIKSLAEGFSELQKSMKENLVPMAEVGQHIGDGSLYTKSFAELRKMVNAGVISEEDLKNIEKQQDKLKAGTDASVAQTKALSDTTLQLNNTATNLQLLFTSSTMVTKSMDMLSSSMEEFSAWALEKAGVELPADLKARREERKAINKVNEAKEKESKLLTAEQEQRERTKTLESQLQTETDPSKRKNLERQLAASRREEEFLQSPAAQEAKREARDEVLAVEKTRNEAEKKRKALSSATGSSSSGSGVSGTSSKDRYAGLRIKSEESTAGGDVEDQLLEIANTIQSTLGDDLKHFTGLNDAYHHKPGNESRQHQSGRALDFTLTDPKKAAAIAERLRSIPGVGLVLDEYTNPNAKTNGKHIHVEMAKIKARTGWDGVFEGPDAGYSPNLELHGKETVSIKPATDKTNEQILILLAQMVDKQEDMIGLLIDSNSDQRKLVNAAT